MQRVSLHVPIDSELLGELAGNREFSSFALLYQVHGKVKEGFRFIELPLSKQEAAFVEKLLQFLLEYNGF